MSTAIRDHTDHDLSVPESGPRSRRSVLARCLVAAVGMLLCALSPALVALVPGFASAVERLATDRFWLAVAVEMALKTVPTVVALVLLLVVARVDKQSLRAYFGQAPAGRAVRLLLVATAAAATLTALVVGVLRLTGLESAAADTAPLQAPVLAVVLTALVQAFALQAIQEEWWFRGFAFHGARGRPWFVLGATTLVFTVLHLVSSGGQSSPVEFVVYLVLPLGMGLWAGVERWCTGSVWAAVGIHGGMHTGLLAATLTQTSGTMPMWIGVGAAFCIAAVLRLLWVRPWLHPAPDTETATR